MIPDRSPTARIVYLADRTARYYDLGKLSLGEACEQLLRIGMQDGIHGRVDVTPEDLLAVGEAAASHFPDEPLLETAIWFGVADFDYQLQTRVWAEAPELATPDSPAFELEAAAVKSCDRALARRRESDLACLAMLLTVGRPEPLLRRATELFPLTPDGRHRGHEMQLQTSLISTLSCAGRYEEAVAQARTLPTGAQRAVAVEAIVSTHYRDRNSDEALPDGVHGLIASTDWSGTRNQLEVTASYLVRAHRGTALALIERWATGQGAAAPVDRDLHINGASLIALVAGDEDAALSIAREDAALPRRAFRPGDDSGFNELADYVIGTLSTDVEERVEHLLRSSRPGAWAFHERRYVDAARLLLEAGELTPAACLFWLQSAGAAGGRRSWGPFDYIDPALCAGIEPSFDEKLALLRDLQAAGVPGTQRFDRITFDNSALPRNEGYPGSAEYLPRSLSALRAGCETYESLPRERRSRARSAR